MARKTRQRQLRRVAQQRALERARQRKRRLLAGAIAVVVAGAGVSVGLALALRDGNTNRPPIDEEAGAACGAEAPPEAEATKDTFDRPPRMRIERNAELTVTMTTSCGTIEAELFARRTPVTVNNFVFLARQGFYDGLTFHRIAGDFVIQGGDPLGTGEGGPGYEFEDEIRPRLKFDRAGLLAMANSGPDTNGSQFFITLAEAPHLDGMHTIFGEVTKGMRVVNRIGRLPTEGERPAVPVYIERVKIQER